ncbi:hypothetical protein MTO96_041081 [Rhipicephalus appendiculatus]
MSSSCSSSQRESARRVVEAWLTARVDEQCYHARGSVEKESLSRGAFVLAGVSFSSGSASVVCACCNGDAALKDCLDDHLLFGSRHSDVQRPVCLSLLTLLTSTGCMITILQHTLHWISRHNPKCVSSSGFEFNL